jgi:hypothetical protein
MCIAEFFTELTRAHFRTACLLSSLVMVFACVGPAPTPDGPFISQKAPFAIEIPSSLRALGGDDTFEMVYQDADGQMFVGVVVDAKPLPLEELDALVEKNLKSAGYDGARVLSVEKTSLGGLPAHRSIIHVLSGERSFLMLNTHAATERESVQLIVWGLSSIGHLVRGMADSLAHNRFRFLEGTRAFVSTERHQLEDDARPFRFATPPTGWTPMRKGALRTGATLELEHKSGGFFAFALSSAHGGLSFLDEKSRLENDLAAMFDVGLGEAATEPHQGAEPDVTWVQSGVLANEKVHVTYHVRLLRVDDTDVQVFCWGESASEGLERACSTMIQTLESRQSR